MEIYVSPTWKHRNLCFPWQCAPPSPHWLTPPPFPSSSLPFPSSGHLLKVNLSPLLFLSYLPTSLSLCFVHLFSLTTVLLRLWYSTLFISVFNVTFNFSFFWKIILLKRKASTHTCLLQTFSWRVQRPHCGVPVTEKNNRAPPTNSRFSLVLKQPPIES